MGDALTYKAKQFILYLSSRSTKDTKSNTTFYQVSLHNSYTRLKVPSDMALEKYNGTWELEDKGGAEFEEYMKYLGVGLVKRKIGKNMGRTMTFKAKSDTSFAVKSVTTLKTNENDDVQLDQEGDNETDDGRQVKVRFTNRNGNLVQIENWPGKNTDNEWEILSDGRLCMHLKGGSDGKVYAKQVYKKK